MRAALEALPGVRDVHVDFESRRATVIVAQGGMATADMIAALAAAGHTAVPVETILRVTGMMRAKSGAT